jgi:hypothetical protein
MLVIQANLIHELLKIANHGFGLSNGRKTDACASEVFQVKDQTKNPIH